MKTFLVIALFVLIGVGVVSSQFDLADHLNTKTPYPSQHSDKHKKDITHRLHQQECTNGEMLHFNLLARHGSREPTSGVIKRLDSLQKALFANSKYISNPDYQWIQDWTNPYTLKNQGLLVYLGQEQHYELAKRYKSQYSVLNIPYYPITYTVQHTVVSRTGVSANSFTYGLFEGEGKLGPTGYLPIFDYSETADEDDVLSFFNNCAQYNVSVINNASSSYQQNMYLNSVLPNIISKVSQKLGVNPSNWNISGTNILNLFVACALDVSINSVIDGFCTLFDEDDILTIETYTDLDDYYSKGYGYPINYLIASPLLVDFFQVFDAVIANQTYSSSKLRFAHAETLIPFVSLLGLYKDNFTLTWDNPNLSNRLWRTSQISPYAGNLAMSLYNCSGVYKVKLTHNEQDMPFPNCGDTLYCPYDTLKINYNSALNTNFEKICAVSKPQLHINKKFI